MGRVKEFQDQKALEKALRLFWLQGYEKTSLKELLKEMDILNGSFYNCFGSKKNLFLKSLENYGQTNAHMREELFSSGKSFKECIRVLFNKSFDKQMDKDEPKGCFLVNCISPEVMAEAEIKDFIRKELNEFEYFLEKQISKAIESGELENQLDSKMTAGLIMAYLQGIMKLSVLDYSDQKFREQTEYFLKSIGL
jgi:TetR/AcrR family transcriptional repressor of nem operon